MRRMMGRYSLRLRVCFETDGRGFQKGLRLLFGGVRATALRLWPLPRNDESEPCRVSKRPLRTPRLGSVFVNLLCNAKHERNRVLCDLSGDAPLLSGVKGVNICFVHDLISAIDDPIDPTLQLGHTHFQIGGYGWPKFGTRDQPDCFSNFVALLKRQMAVL